MLHYLYVCVKAHIDSAPGLDIVLAEWPLYAPDVFDAITDNQKIWRFFSGLKIGTVPRAQSTLDSLGYGASMLFDSDLPGVTPT